MAAFPFHIGLDTTPLSFLQEASSIPDVAQNPIFIQLNEFVHRELPTEDFTIRHQVTNFRNELERLLKIEASRKLEVDLSLLESTKNLSFFKWLYLRPITPGYKLHMQNYFNNPFGGLRFPPRRQSMFRPAVVQFIRTLITDAGDVVHFPALGVQDRIQRRCDLCLTVGVDYKRCTGCQKYVCPAHDIAYSCEGCEEFFCGGKKCSKFSCDKCCDIFCRDCVFYCSPEDASCKKVRCSGCVFSFEAENKKECGECTRVRDLGWTCSEHRKKLRSCTENCHHDCEYHVHWTSECQNHKCDNKDLLICPNAPEICGKHRYPAHSCGKCYKCSSFDTSSEDENSSEEDDDDPSDQDIISFPDDTTLLAPFSNLHIDPLPERRFFVTSSSMNQLRRVLHVRQGHYGAASMTTPRTGDTFCKRC